MRLISCHIENFGVLSDENITFDSTLTARVQRNGEGKTTLAAFIKAMFYGLSSYTKTTVEFTDRRRYYPFSQGVFGGTLTFEMDAREYVIERSFGEKSATKDTLAVYCNGSLTEELGDCIGRTLFGLDMESFERTLFVTADDMELCGTGGINGKLNRYGDADADKAVKALEEEAKKFKGKQKNKGSIALDENLRAETERQIRGLEALDLSLDALYARRKEINSEIEALKARKGSALMNERWKAYDDILSQAEDCRKRADGILSGYPKGIPDGEAVEAAKKLLEERAKAEILLNFAVFDGEKEGELSALDSLFSGGEPSEGELLGVSEEIKSAENAEAEIRALRSRSKKAELDALRASFGGRIPDEAQMARLDSLRDGYKEKSASLLEVSGRREAAKKSFPAASAVLGLIGAVCVICGIIVFSVVGALLCGAGAVCLLAAVLVYFAARIKSVEDTRGTELRLQVRTAEEALKNALSMLGISKLDDPLSAIEDLKSRRQRYFALCEEENELSNKTDGLALAIEASKKYISQFFGAYGLSAENAREALEEIRRKRDRRAELLKEKEGVKRRRAELGVRIAEYGGELCEFFAGYREDSVTDSKTAIEGLEEDKRLLGSLLGQRAELLKKAELYKAENGLSERPRDDVGDILEIEKELDGKRESLDGVEREIADAESKMERLFELRAQKEELDTRIAEGKETHRLITGAMELLRTADTSLKEKYIFPIRSRFEKYSEAICRAFGDGIELDKDFRVSFYKNGKKRDDRHLSAGQRCVWALCLRLAFIDELFGDDVPFIILDDPFVSLDKENMEKVARLLGELGEGRQMVYLTCHESRTIL